MLEIYFNKVKEITPKIVYLLLRRSLGFAKFDLNLYLPAFSKNF